MEIDYNYLHNALDRVEHTSTVDAFHYQFQVIQNLIVFLHPEIPDSYFASRSIHDLQVDFQNFLVKFNLTTVIAAYKLASIYEESVYLDYFPESDELLEENIVVDHTLDVHSVEEPMYSEDCTSRKEALAISSEDVLTGKDSPNNKMVNSVVLAPTITSISEGVCEWHHSDAGLGIDKDDVEVVEDKNVGAAGSVQSAIQYTIHVNCKDHTEKSVVDVMPKASSMVSLNVRVNIIHTEQEGNSSFCWERGPLSSRFKVQNNSPYIFFSDIVQQGQSEFVFEPGGRSGDTFLPLSSIINLRDSSHVTVVQSIVLKDWENLKETRNLCHVVLCSSLADYFSLVKSSMKGRMSSADIPNDFSGSQNVFWLSNYHSLMCRYEYSGCLLVKDSRYEREDVWKIAGDDLVATIQNSKEVYLTFPATSCTVEVVIINTTGDTIIRKCTLYALIKISICGVRLKGNWNFDPSIFCNLIIDFCEMNQVVEKVTAGTAGGIENLYSIQYRWLPSSYVCWKAMAVSARMFYHGTFAWEPGPSNSGVKIAHTTELDAGKTSKYKFSVDNHSSLVSHQKILWEVDKMDGNRNFTGFVFEPGGKALHFSDASMSLMCVFDPGIICNNHEGSAMALQDLSNKRVKMVYYIVYASSVVILQSSRKTSSSVQELCSALMYSQSSKCRKMFSTTVYHMRLWPHIVMHGHSGSYCQMMGSYKDELQGYVVRSVQLAWEYAQTTLIDADTSLCGSIFILLYSVYVYLVWKDDEFTCLRAWPDLESIIACETSTLSIVDYNGLLVVSRECADRVNWDTYWECKYMNSSTIIFNCQGKEGMRLVGLFCDSQFWTNYVSDFCVGNARLSSITWERYLLSRGKDYLNVLQPSKMGVTDAQYHWYANMSPSFVQVLTDLLVGVFINGTETIVKVFDPGVSYEVKAIRYLYLVLALCFGLFQRSYLGYYCLEKVELDPLQQLAITLSASMLTVRDHQRSVETEMIGKTAKDNENASEYVIGKEDMLTQHVPKMHLWTSGYMEAVSLSILHISQLLYCSVLLFLCNNTLLNLIWRIAWTPLGRLQWLDTRNMSKTPYGQVGIPHSS